MNLLKLITLQSSGYVRGCLGLVQSFQLNNEFLLEGMELCASKLSHSVYKFTVWRGSRGGEREEQGKERWGR